MDIYIIKEHEDDYLKLVRDGQLIYFSTSDPNHINWNYPAYEFPSIPRALAVFNKFVATARSLQTTVPASYIARVFETCANTR